MSRPFSTRSEIIANSYDKLEMHDLAADTRRVLELNKGKTVKVRR